MVRFSAFEFDAETRRLRRDGADIHLSPKAFYLLELLLEAAPRVVGKRELTRNSGRAARWRTRRWWR